MVSGGMALLLLLIAVAIIIVLTGRFKMNAFLVLIGIAFAYGLAIGIPGLEVIKLVKGGFGGTLTNIGRASRFEVTSSNMIERPPMRATTGESLTPSAPVASTDDPE